MKNEQNSLNKGSDLASPQKIDESTVDHSDLIVESPYEYVYGGDTYEDNWCS